MKKRWKWFAPLFLILLALILAFTMFFVYIRFIKNGESFDIYDMDSWFNEYNMVFSWEAAKLYEGMTSAERYKALGKPNCVVGSGDVREEYRCFNGKYLYVDKNGKYYFEEERLSGSLVEADLATPSVVCFILSTVLVFGGYTVIRLCRKKKAALQVSPEDTPDPGEAQ